MVGGAGRWNRREGRGNRTDRKSNKEETQPKHEKKHCGYHNPNHFSPRRPQREVNWNSGNSRQAPNHNTTCHPHISSRKTWWHTASNNNSKGVNGGGLQGRNIGGNAPCGLPRGEGRIGTCGADARGGETPEATKKHQLASNAQLMPNTYTPCCSKNIG